MSYNLPHIPQLNSKVLRFALMISVCSIVVASNNLAYGNPDDSLSAEKSVVVRKIRRLERNPVHNDDDAANHFDFQQNDDHQIKADSHHEQSEAVHLNSDNVGETNTPSEPIAFNTDAAVDAHEDEDDADLQPIENKEDSNVELVEQPIEPPVDMLTPPPLDSSDQQSAAALQVQTSQPINSKPAEAIDEDLRKAVASIRTIRRDLINTFKFLDDDNPSAEQLKAQYYVITPTVADPRWNDAMALLETGKCSAAKKIAEDVVGPTENLNADSNPGISYAMARIDLCSGNRARAYKTLTTLAARKDPVGTIASQLIGKAKDSDPYNEPIEHVSDLIKNAVDLGKQGKVEAALRQLDALYTTVDTRRDRFNVRLAQANILERAGRIGQAANLYLQLYRRTRGSAANAPIEDRLERLERISKTTYLSFGERVDRMVHLIRRGRYRDAKNLSIQNATLRGFNDSELNGMTYLRQAFVAERKRDREKAVSLFKKAYRLVKDDEVRPRIYLGWARALRRLDQDHEAIKLYQKLASEYPDNYLAGEAHYQAGRLLQFLDDQKEAIIEFDAALATLKDNDERDDDPGWAADALWRAGFANILLERWDNAIQRLERLRDNFGAETDSSDLSQGLKATYWIGVANLRAGRLKIAQKNFQQTIDRGKLTWYGRLAAARLSKEKMPYNDHLPNITLDREPVLDKNGQPQVSLSGLAVEKDPRLAVAVEFGKLGLWHDARSSAIPLLNAHPTAKGAAAIVASVDLLDGDPAAAHWRMQKVIDEAGPNQFTLRGWGTAFPNNYAKLADTYGTQYHVAPALVQAIIRQESGFRPKVRSYAGAVGLMQLMPGTARYVIRDYLTDKSYSRGALIDPETNVELGTMYIRLHTAYASDSIPVALAGYNAGSGPQSSWINRYGDRDLDAWVESITYQEARGYVRKVFTSYTAYLQLYEGKLPVLDLDAPRKLKAKNRVWGKLPEKKPGS